MIYPISRIHKTDTVLSRCKKFKYMAYGSVQNAQFLVD